MARMTLHEAQTAVDAIYKRDNLYPDGWWVRWDDPVGEATRYAIIADDMPDAVLEKAAKEISAALVAYKAHLDFETGKAFADAATVRHLEAEGTRLRHNAAVVGDALVARAADIREGLHYAEPEAQQ